MAPPTSPAAAGEDLFAVLGVPRRFAQDPADLERRFRERARASHPDRFARAPAGERRLAVLRTARLNEAHRTLVPARARAAYLLQLLDGPPAATVDVFDPGVLEEALALRERIATASAAQDVSALARLAEGIASRLAALEVRLAELLAPDLPSPEARHAAASLLAEARLLDRALEAAHGSQPDRE